MRKSSKCQIEELKFLLKEARTYVIRYSISDWKKVRDGSVRWLLERIETALDGEQHDRMEKVGVGGCTAPHKGVDEVVQETHPKGVRKTVQGVCTGVFSVRSLEGLRHVGVHDGSGRRPEMGESVSEEKFKVGDKAYYEEKGEKVSCKLVLLGVGGRFGRVWRVKPDTSARRSYKTTMVLEKDLIAKETEVLCLQGGEEKK